MLSTTSQKYDIPTKLRVSTHIAVVPRTMWYVAENREVQDRNIGVPPVCKYASYRTLGNTLLHHTLKRQ